MLRKVQNNHLGKSVLFYILQLYKKQYSSEKWQVDIICWKACIEAYTRKIY